MKTGIGSIVKYGHLPAIVVEIKEDESLLLYVIDPDKGPHFKLAEKDSEGEETTVERNAFESFVQDIDVADVADDVYDLVLNEMVVPHGGTLSSVTRIEGDEKQPVKKKPRKKASK